MLCTLSDFHHIRPYHEIEQEKSLDWIAEAHAKAAFINSSQGLDHQEFKTFRTQIREKLARMGLGKERIQNRGVLINDLFEEDGSRMRIYPVEENPYGHGFTERSEFFDREVSKILEQFYAEEAILPEHLIHVTCTGYVAPSPAQKLVSSRKAGTTTAVTHAYHMGCYGSIPAIRIAAGYLSLSPSFSLNIDIIHTEVCSLHMHPMRHCSEQLLVESLFADGFIKYTLHSKKKDAPHLTLLGLHEETISDSIQSMTWRCEDHGLSMTLSKNVPVLIARAINDYLHRLCSIAGLSSEKIVKEAFFAIHPGGPKILQQIKDLLKLESYQLEHSESTLKQFGNMSSATLPHIWEKMLKCSRVPSKALIVGLAFGPGLSIAGALFEKGTSRSS
jgi:predicted naringenin-chalcone synthase